MPETAIWWVRQDLRLADNPALSEAGRDGRPVLAVHVLDEAAAGAWAWGGAQRWWLHHGLAALAADLARLGVQLVLRRGDAATHLAALAAGCGGATIHAAAAYEPWARRQEQAVAARAPLHLHRARTLTDPERVRTGAGGPYGVYSPFMRAVRAGLVDVPPLPAPARLIAAPTVASDRLEQWGLLPTAPDWAGGLSASWTPGEAGGQARLADFLAASAAGYAAGRDLPGVAATSRLSAFLQWGHLSARQVWHAAQAADLPAGARDKFLNELLWREFSIHLLWHHPHLPDRPLRPAFAAMPWRRDDAGLAAWQAGRTGIPLVDAGMRELWQTGWMHNRVRMITASFLVKHLLLDWRDGQAWFWDTLVDADLAANAASWQWVAGCGAAAAPYFRIFNPALQGAKFDADGAYVRRFVPELARLPDRWLHAPWLASPMELHAAGVRLGASYPAPLIGLDAGRARALAALKTIGQAAGVGADG